jgi:hypothetical protein
VVSGGNEFFGDMEQQNDRLYVNDGKGHFTRNVKALPNMFENKSVVKPIDIDRDGDLDLFVAGRVVAYNYGASPQSFLLINNGKGVFTNQIDKLAPDLKKIGMISEAIWQDLDKDGDLDLTVVGDWMPVTTFENKKGKLQKVDNGLEEFIGFWSGISAGDFDKDGDIDLMVGNLGTNTKLRKEANGQLKMWIKDIDNNQNKEQIIGYSRGKNWYPINSKDEMGKQIPSIINKKYTNYKSFAGKSIEELFDDDELEGAEEKIVNTFESVYLENTGNFTFKSHALPSLAQVSKILVLRTEDTNGDGNLDVIVGGNFNGASMYQARYDGFFGLILLGDGKGNFKAQVPTESGFLMDGDVRDIQLINLGKIPLYLVSRNNEPIQVYRKINK